MQAAAMHSLSELIEWHREQLVLAQRELEAADVWWNRQREADTEILRDTIARLESTLRHLEDLRKLIN